MARPSDPCSHRPRPEFREVRQSGYLMTTGATYSSYGKIFRLNPTLRIQPGVLEIDATVARRYEEPLDDAKDRTRGNVLRRRRKFRLLLGALTTCQCRSQHDNKNTDLPIDKILLRHPGHLVYSRLATEDCSQAGMGEKTKKPACWQPVERHNTRFSCRLSGSFRKLPCRSPRSHGVIGLFRKA